MLYLRHSVALIRADKLFSTIYVAGTAVAIASAMVVAIFVNIILADIPPESNRSRTLYLTSYYRKASMSNGEWLYTQFSTEAIDSCFRKIECVEAVAGFMSYLYYLDYKVSDDIAPLEVQSENIRSIILNHRKINILNRLQADLLKEAEKSDNVKRYI